MRFGVLGPVEVRLPDGSPVAVGGPQVRALLAMLLLDAGRAVSADRLADGLYGTPPADVAHAVQSQVSRLRRGLRGGATVDFGAAGYRLAAPPDAVDVHQFARLAAQGRQALAAGDPSRAAASLTTALELWRGPALADVLDAPFAEAAATRLAEERLAVAEDRAEAVLALGEHHAVAAELTELVAAHPLRERARALLMRALYAGGRQAAALTVFAEGQRVLADELGVDPSAELADAHLAILRAEPAPARRVPAQLTSFVGREGDLARLVPLLGSARLVTLTGPGGTGKTRLAIEASGRVPGEVCFADLSPLTDAAQLGPALAAALGLRDADQLVSALSDRSLLVVLDNCEHVIAGAAALVHRLLGACPTLRVLATSREALGITGEALFPVGQLAVPGPAAGLDEALRQPAIRLFADRACAVRPGFAVDAATIGAVRRICAALDGLPLAIELAAARLRSLTLDDIDARLADRFRLLSRGERTAAPRHQTLRAVVEWSWDLLSPEEQALARRLTVFAGGVTLADAERVLGGDVADVLPDLVDKSLVEAHDGRYRMLETVREFCAARRVEDLARAHAECFVELAETADERLRGPEQLTWLSRLAAEHDNLQAALRWAVDEDPALALRLIAALSWFWWLRGLRSAAAPLALRLLTRLTGDEPAEEYACCAVTAAGAGDVREHLDRAMGALTAPLRRPQVVLLLAMVDRLVLLGPGPYFGADPWSRAFARMGDGLAFLMSGRPDAAWAEFGAALAGFRALGDRWGIASALDKLAIIADWRGEPAIPLMDEAIAVTAELGRVEDAADLLTRRADILARSGDLAAARAGYERALDFARAVGSPDLRANARRGLGDVARWSGSHETARAHFTEALAECGDVAFGPRETRTRILTSLGWLAQAEGDAAAARDHLRAALDMAEGNAPAAAGALEALAGVALAETDRPEAAKLLAEAETLRGLPIPPHRDVTPVTKALA
jgi:predicted ATPase/DNA-binding SARP family transcriptional activator